MTFTIQSNFNRGELAPELERREDLEHYFAGLRRATNVTSIPQGGLKRRPGLRYIAELAGKARLIPFEFSVEQTYIVALSDQTIEVFSTGDAETAPYLVATLESPYNINRIFDAYYPVRWAQQADTLILVHGDFVPTKLMREFPDGVETWTLYKLADEGALDIHGLLLTPSMVGNAITIGPPSGDYDPPGRGALLDLPLAEETLSDIPKYNFKDDYTPTETDEVQILTFAGDWTTAQTYKLKLSSPTTSTIPDLENKTQTTREIRYRSTIEAQVEEIRSKLQELPMLADLEDCILVEKSATDPTEVKGPYKITFQNGAGNLDWPELIAVDLPAGGQTIGVTEDTEGASGEEPVWSRTRGWPRSVTFHEQRLVFGGAPYLPATVWMSRTDDPFNFWEGDALDDEAVGAFMGSGRLDAVNDVVSLRNIVTLTSGAEFYSPEIPVTPRNVAFRRDTARGSAAIRPVVLDGSIIFVQRDRTAIQQLLFTDAENAYVAEDLTILSRHMLDSPQDMDCLQGTLGDHIMVVQGDGSMIVLNTNRAHGVNAWTRYTTRDGDSFISVAALHSYAQQMEAWVCVERALGGETKYTLEKFDEDAYLDCSVYQDPALLYGITHLAGEDVTIKVNGRHVINTTVNGTGQVDIDFDANTLEVGFNSCLPDVETLPAVVPGSRSSFRKTRVLRATLDLLDSYDVWVGLTDDALVTTDPPIYEAEDAVLDGAAFGTLELVTGQREVRLLGWYERPTVKIKQFSPMPFYIRGIELELVVNK